MVPSEIYFLITLLPIFVAGSSSLDGQVLIGLFVCFLVNGKLLSLFYIFSILQIEVPANYSLFHPPIENGKTMEVKFARLYII